MSFVNLDGFFNGFAGTPKNILISRLSNSYKNREGRANQQNRFLPPHHNFLFIRLWTDEQIFPCSASRHLGFLSLLYLFEIFGPFFSLSGTPEN